MIGKFSFLGTGASAGVPSIGCKCSVCTSPSKFNQRLRPSGLLQLEGKRLLIDAGPDFRAQALRIGLDKLDGLLLTHTHYDHIAGIDELRVFCLKEEKDLPCLLSQESFESIKMRYPYLLQRREESVTLSARLDLHILPELNGTTTFLDIPISYVSYNQGNMGVTGYRIGNFAYLSDIKEYSDAIFSYLDGVESFVISALCQKQSHVHLSLDEAIALGKKIGAKQTIITHMNHRIDYEKVNSTLPEGVQLGYDGMEISFDY